MDFLRQQWTLIQERLAGLTPSQRMLVGALVVITVMSMLYWGKYASSREMVALNTVPMSAEEIATATQSLRNKGISFTTAGTTIMVPADDQMSALSDLSFNQALPTSPNFFESMFEKISAFGTAGDYKARLNNARERTLSAMISGFPDVKSASVLINDPQISGIGRFEPRATVNIMTRSGSGVKKLAQSACMLVLNAVSGLKRENISVMVDGQSLSAPSDTMAGAGNEALDIIRSFENDMAGKVRSTFVQFIPSIVVSVTADVDTQSKREVIQKVDPTNKIVLPNKTTTETMTSNEPSLSAEPGLTANAGIDVNSAPAPMAGSSTEKTTEENTVGFGKSETEVSTPAGKARIVGAAVRVPRSYFVNLWRAKTRKIDAEPSDTEYAAVSEKAIAEMRGEVQQLTAITDATKISVTEFPDLEGLANLMKPTQASTMGNVSLIAGNYVKEGAIGVLALASLFMVSRIVKKSVPPPTLALAGMGGAAMSASTGGGQGGSARNKGPSTFAAEEYIAGEVAEGGAVMMGQELDPATLETAQMVEQVQSYVKSNPDTAATLIRRLMAHE
jgi:flagellar biosynthesis/type III secretory pathway M-ring protein FliF/YscJ